MCPGRVFGLISNLWRRTALADLPPPSRAERGLSNYLVFERVKQDPKIAKHAAKMDKFTDDENGNLVRVAPPSAAAPTVMR